MSEQLIKNKTYTFTVESLCGNGNGIARCDGFVVFIPCTAQGDIVQAKVIKVTKSYAVAKLEKIITASPSRIYDGCPQMSKCGGCSFAHISYSEECRIKRAMIDDSFERIGNLALRTENFFGAEKTERYRNKAIYPVAADKNGKLISGFYANMSHRLVEHDDCFIGPEIFSKIKDSVLEIFSEKLCIDAYDEKSGKGTLRSIYMRKSSLGKLLLTLVVNADGIGKSNEEAFCRYITEKYPEVSGILLNTNKKTGNSLLGEKWRTLWGDSFLQDTLCGKKFRIAPAAFYQVNHEQTERLYGIAKSFAEIKENETVFDLYCGTGTIGIILAEKGVKLVGVEISREAAANAAENAKINGVDAEFICLDAGEALNSPRIAEKKPDVILIDPPRKGCGDEAAEKIASFGAGRIVYISCNPQTLARDLAKFTECGYKAVRAVGVDLFPRTGHVETVVLLQRQNT